MQASNTDSVAPCAADFSLDIHGCEMAPTIPSGSTVFIQRGSIAASGDIVLVMHEGNILCRRMLDDPFGNIYFVCDNPNHADDSIMIRRDEVANTVCFGTVVRIRLPDGEETKPQPYDCGI